MTQVDLAIVDPMGHVPHVSSVLPTGKELLSPTSTQEAQILAKKPRWRMACKAIVGYGMQEGDMTLQVNPRQWES